MSLSVPIRAIVIALVINSLWGGNPVAVKFSLVVFPPMWSAFFRFVLAILSISVWAVLKRVQVWPSRHEWPVLMGIGALFTLQIGAMNVGFDNTTGAMGSVLIATNPLFAVFFSHFLVPDDKLTAAKIGGLLLALTGSAVVLIQDVAAASVDVRSWGNWIVLASATMLGLRLALSARVLRRIDEVRVALWQMVLSLPLFAVAGIALERIRWENLGWQALAGLAYQGVVVAGLGFMTAFYLFKHYTPSVMMSFNFVSPIAGVLLSAWLLGDRISAQTGLGMSLVAVGLVIIARKSPG